jgi:hypothetical protein
MVILGLSIVFDIVNPEIYRDRCIAIAPDQTYQVDIIYNLMLLAAPMPINQSQLS